MNDKNIIFDSSETDCRKIASQHNGEIINLYVDHIEEKKKPKFSVGETVETIEEYDDIDCPPERGAITDIIENGGDVLYEINYEILIYEKWLRKI